MHEIQPVETPFRIFEEVVNILLFFIAFGLIINAFVGAN